jgi:digeranylgeranylglycerophospholipid reductase
MEEGLARKAQRYGARIRLGEEVRRVERGEGCLVLNGEIRAKLVIGADGALSVVREFTGERLQNMGYGLNVKTTLGERGLKVFVDPEKVIPFGDAWVFSGKRANVGIWTAHRGYVGEVGRRWERFRKERGLSPLTPRGAFIPSGPPTRTSSHRLLLAGDAGGLNDPLTGAGIYSALLTGYLAGRVAAEAIKKGKFSASHLKKYERLWKGFMGGELRRSLLLSRLRGFLMQEGNPIALLPLRLFLSSETKQKR